MANSVLLITISGEDQPGLVRKMSKIVASMGANWEQSRMMHLSGRFVGLLEIHVAENDVETLESRLREIGELEMTIAKGKSAADPSRTFQLEVLGADHPGIVSEIFGVLADSGVNVETLTTRTEPAADSGMPLFRIQARLGTQRALNLGEIQKSLEAIAQDLMVNVEIEEGG